MVTTATRDARPASGAVAATRLTPFPRQRRLSWALLGVLLVAGSGLAFAAWSGSVGDRVPVLVLRQGVAAGEVLADRHLTTADVAAGTSVELVPAHRRGEVVGRRVTTALGPGTPLAPSLLAAGPVLRRGQAVVGVALEPGELPAGGVAAGDPVMVVAVPGEGPEVGVAAPVVWPAEVHAVGSAADEAALVGVTVVSLRVARDDAASVAAAAAADRVRLVLVASLDDVPRHLLPEAVP